MEQHHFVAGVEEEASSVANETINASNLDHQQTQNITAATDLSSSSVRNDRLHKAPRDPPNHGSSSTSFLVLQSETQTSETCINTRSTLECPICLQSCIHPARLPCGHIFCFLCVKGVAYKNRRCAMCRREIPSEFLDHPQLVNGIDDICLTRTLEDGYQWYYEGRNGWWQYDDRTSQDIEEAFKKGEKSCTILVAGYVYIVDLEAMLQQRQNEPTRCRRVKRDLATIAKKGVAGLRIGDNIVTADPNFVTQIQQYRLPPSTAALDLALPMEYSLRPSVESSVISNISANDTGARMATAIVGSTPSNTDELSHSSGDTSSLQATIAFGSGSILHATSPAGSSVMGRTNRESVNITENLLNDTPNMHMNTIGNLQINNILDQTLINFQGLSVRSISIDSSSDEDGNVSEDYPNGQLWF